MNFQTINPILIRKGRLRPPIGFVLPKSLLTKTCYCSQLYGRFQQKYETPCTAARRQGEARRNSMLLLCELESLLWQFDKWIVCPTRFVSAIVWCLLIDDLSHIISRLSVLLELACLLPASQPDILASQCTVMRFFYLKETSTWKIQVNSLNFIFLLFWGRLGEKFQKWPYFWVFEEKKIEFWPEN